MANPLINAWRHAWRKWVTDGVPSSSEHNPDKDDILPIGEMITEAITGGQLSIVTAQHLVQKRLCVINAGFNNGVVDTQIFSGAENAPQGFCEASYGGIDRFFFRQRITGTGVDERQRIVQIDAVEDGSTVVPTIWSDELNIGHQILSPFTEGGDLWFVVSLPSDPAYPGTNIGKGYAKIKWRGSLTDQSDVVGNRLFGYSGSSHRFEDLYSSNSAIAADGQSIAVLALDTKDGDIDDTSQYMLLFDRSDAEAAGLSADVITGPWPVIPPTAPGLFYRQGLTWSPNGGHIAVLRGYIDSYGKHMLQIFDRFGNPVREIYFDDARANYTKAQLDNNATLGIPVSFEPEDAHWSDKGITVIIQEGWRLPGKIVTWRGQNYATRRVDSLVGSPTFGQNIGNEPSDSTYWQLTTKAATDGAWNAATDYGGPGNYTKREKVVYRIQVETGTAGEEPLETGLTQKLPGSTLYSGVNLRDQGYGYGTVWQLSAWIANTARGLWLNSLAFAFNIFRIYDTRNGADNAKFSSLSGVFTGTDEISEWRVRSNIASGAGVNIYGNAHVGTVPGGGRAYGGGLPRIQWDRYGQTLLVADATYIPLNLDRGDNGKFEDWRVASISVGGKWIGNGSPEGVIPAPKGSEFVRLDGGTGTSHYFKESGTGNTGWVAK